MCNYDVRVRIPLSGFETQRKKYKVRVKYGKANEYYIFFNANGGTGDMYSYKPDFYETNISPNQFVKEGYDFVGWNTQPDGSGVSYSDEGLITLVADVTLYAQWKIKKFTLTYKHSYGDSKLLISNLSLIIILGYLKKYLI